jgi:hypothetical protein
MRFSHEEIIEKIPEYVKRGLIPDDIRTHIDTCRECSQEFSLLTALNEVSVPEPGDMFFDALPQKIRAAVKREKKGFFFRLVPVFALFAVLVIGGYVYYMAKMPVADDGFLLSDPFASHVHDLSGLKPGDIPSIDDTIVEFEMYLSGGTPYIREFALLDSDELEDLYEALSLQKENGGVL